jgi:hypothetical protein
MNLGIVGDFVTNYAEISFIRRTIFYGVGCFVSYRCLDLLWCVYFILLLVCVLIYCGVHTFSDGHTLLI